MTTPSQQPIPPLAGALLGAGEMAETDEERVERDADGTPVGRDDLRADIERSGGDPDRV